MRIIELRLREPLGLIRGQVTRVLFEAANGTPMGGWKMAAGDHGVRITKVMIVKAKEIPVSRIVPWGMIQFAEVAPDSESLSLASPKGKP
jgi:hypothetical protein